MSDANLKDGLKNLKEKILTTLKDYQTREQGGTDRRNNGDLILNELLKNPQENYFPYILWLQNFDERAITPNDLVMFDSLCEVLGKRDSQFQKEPKITPETPITQEKPYYWTPFIDWDYSSEWQQFFMFFAIEKIGENMAVPVPRYRDNLAPGTGYRVTFSPTRVAQLDAILWPLEKERQRITPIPADMPRECAILGDAADHPYTDVTNIVNNQKQVAAIYCLESLLRFRLTNIRPDFCLPNFHKTGPHQGETIVANTKVEAI